MLIRELMGTFLKLNECYISLRDQNEGQVLQWCHDQLELQ